MLLSIPDILSPEQVDRCRQELAAAEWVDGRNTAGHQGARVKRNAQVPRQHPVARRLGEMIMETLDHSPRFAAAVLPLRVLPPTFNRYEPGETFGVHIDGAIRQVPGTAWRVRTDLSATLFLSAPDDYEGGELTVQDAYGTHRVKLAAGDLVLYPAGSLHCVTPVTRGVRLAAFFWVQSMVRDDAHRTMLHDLDTAIQHLTPDQPDHPALVQLTGVYHNLLRCWAET